MSQAGRQASHVNNTGGMGIHDGLLQPAQDHWHSTRGHGHRM